MRHSLLTLLFIVATNHKKLYKRITGDLCLWSPSFIEMLRFQSLWRVEKFHKKFPRRKLARNEIYFAPRTSATWASHENQSDLSIKQLIFCVPVHWQPIFWPLLISFWLWMKKAANRHFLLLGTGTPAATSCVKENSSFRCLIHFSGHQCSSCDLLPFCPSGQRRRPLNAGGRPWSRNAEAINIRGAARGKGVWAKSRMRRNKGLSGFGVFRPLCGATIDNWGSQENL